MDIGPNVKRLIFHKMSRDAIPDGGGIAAGIQFLRTPGAIGKGFQAATEWVKAAIEAVRQAAEPNPWKGSDDETIATEIMRKIGERKL